MIWEDLKFDIGDGLDYPLSRKTPWSPQAIRRGKAVSPLYWLRVLLCGVLLTIAECAAALAEAVAPEEVKRLRRRY
jgi:hypothetical protein